MLALLKQYYHCRNERRTSIEWFVTYIAIVPSLDLGLFKLGHVAEYRVLGGQIPGTSRFNSRLAVRVANSTILIKQERL
jgi:hypothetical protein